ncbi:GNAT family N-acetyltransferase [Arthrobacter sp. 9AX]|uniref:GNAT family N-acetyltransferase n=1 Tax=Arthrobacter sp. 9AX TaxID=2653131 RepID=UPI003FA4D35E
MNRRISKLPSTLPATLKPRTYRNSQTSTCLPTATESHPDKEKAAGRFSAVTEGAHGTPIPQASLLTADREGRVTAAIITIEKALGGDGPGTAFIADLFTHPDHRRQGLAEELLSHAMNALHETGHKTLAVTVNSSNPPRSPSTSPAIFAASLSR